MSHKTKAERQHEAQLRRRKYLPKLEHCVADALSYRNANPGSQWAVQQLEIEMRRLERGYVDAGYSATEALGMSKAAAAGRPGSWLIGGVASAQEPEFPVARTYERTIQGAVTQIMALGPDATAVFMEPHPCFPAIRVLAFGGHWDGSLTVRLSILSIRDIEKALNAIGVKAYLSEAAYQLELRKSTALSAV
jgi:hypothetical protein